MATDEDINLATKQIFALKIWKDTSEEGIHSLLTNLNRNCQSKLVFWSKVWSHFRVNEVDMINLYRKQKVSFQRLFELISHRINTNSGNKIFSQEERDILSEMEHLLSTDDLVLNSTHVILILRSMKYLKDKKNESSAKASGVSQLDRYRYIIVHLMYLLRLRLYLNSRSLDNTMQENLQSILQQFSAVMEKYKPQLDYDTAEKGRLETSKNTTTLLISRVDGFISKSLTIGSENFWWCEDIRVIVEDMISIEHCVVSEKMGENFPKNLPFPFTSDFSEEDKRNITDLASSLSTREPRVDEVVSSVFNRDQNSEWVARFLGLTEFGGFVDDLGN